MQNMATINFDINSLTFNQSENHEQRAARNRIKLESTIPITGPPGTGKSTVISSCCFELVNEYSPVLVVTPTNSMVNSILAKIDGLARSSNLRLPRGFIIRYDKQLPPPSHDYVATSLFRSILNHFSSTLLRKEYRFNKDILDLINPYYDNKLVADYSVQDISTADIAEKDYQGINDNLRKILQHDKKIVFVDTNDDRREDKHFINPGEVSIIKDILNGCQSIGIKSIMVITPYKQQERMLQLQLQQQDMQAIRIGTVDKFQGQEAEVAIISMVRSNTKQDYHEAIGFLNNSRACVAFSRGKRKTIIVGDQTTLIKNKFLARSIDTITRKDGFFIWRNSN